MFRLNRWPLFNRLSAKKTKPYACWRRVMKITRPSTRLIWAGYSLIIVSTRCAVIRGSRISSRASSLANGDAARQWNRREARDIDGLAGIATGAERGGGRGPA